MLRLLAPDAVSPSLFELSLDLLQDRGISGLLVDLDNTLIPYKETDATPEAIAWVQKARARGFGVCIASNARRGRVRRVTDELGVPGIPNAAKPTARALRQGMRLLRTGPEQTAIIGDQLFTDVLGGNRIGLFTVLVNPLSDADLGATKVMRRLERKAWRRLVQRGLLSREDWLVRQRKVPQDY